MFGKLRCVVLRSTKSREDLEDYTPSVPPQEQNEKPRHHRRKSSFFRLFRSSSDPDLHANSRTRRSFGWRRKSHEKKQPPETTELDNSLPANGVDTLPVNGVDSLPVNGIDSLPVKSLPVDPLPVDQLPVDSLQVDPLSVDPLSIYPLPGNSPTGYSLPVEEPLHFKISQENVLLVDPHSVDPLSIDPLPGNSLPVDALPPDDPAWRRAKEVWEKNETEETKEIKEKKRKNDKKKHKKRDEDKEHRKREDKNREKEEKRKERREKRERSREKKKERDSSKHRDRSGSKHRSSERKRHDGDSRDKHKNKRRTESEGSNDSKHSGHRSRKHKHKHDKDEKESKHGKERKIHYSDSRDKHKRRTESEGSNDSRHCRKHKHKQDKHERESRHRTEIKKENIHELDKLELDAEEVKQVMDKLDGVERLKRLGSRDRKDKSRDHGDTSRDREHRSHCREGRHRSRSKEKHVSIDSEGSHHSYNCSACQRSLKEFEARQEQCSADIDTARRSIEHKIKRLEKKFDQQFSSTEKHLDDDDGIHSNKEKYHNVVGELSDHFQQVTQNLKSRTKEMESELTELTLNVSNVEAVNTRADDLTPPVTGERTQNGQNFDKVINAHAELRTPPGTGGLDERSFRDKGGSMSRAEKGIKERCQRLARSSPVLWPSASREETTTAVIEDRSQAPDASHVRVSQSNALDTLNEPNSRGAIAKSTLGSSSDITTEALQERDQDLAENLFEKFIDSNEEHETKGAQEGTISDEASEALQMKYRRQIRDIKRRCRERSQEEQEILHQRISELEVLLRTICTKKSP